MLNATAMFLDLNKGQIAYVVLFGEYVKLKEYEKHSELKQKEGVRKKEEGTCESSYRARRENVFKTFQPDKIQELRS
ncbi:MAG: hypothetical protein LBH33_02605 [Endomicrobium sp.]|jgi:hypothetical protein|nr:hypothetical protein [Endomicrobium sp.]